MPIPYRAVNDVDTLPPAGFLRLLVREDANLLGAIFQATARGEPVEFTLCAVSAPEPRFWREADLGWHGRRVLLEALLQAAPRVPSVLLVLPDEFDPQLFQSEIQPSVPVGAIVPDGAGRWRCEWLSAQPSITSPARRVVGELATRGILREPFERALAGLQQAAEEHTAPA